MKKISPKSNVVLWGHKILLMLRLNNKQKFNEYYSPMHEKYYTKNQNISENLSNFINMNKPEIIVDCDAGNMLGEIPKKLINYKKEFSEGNISVFIRK